MLSAGMSKRVYADFAGAGGGSYPVMNMRRVGDVRGGTKQAYAFRNAPPKRFRNQRWSAGRGTRPGSYMYRKFRGLPRARGLGIETKFLDTARAAAAVAAAPATAAWTGQDYSPATTGCFNSPLQGTGASNREGRFITMQSVQVAGTVRWANQADQAAADTVPYVRYWVVLDRQCNGTAFATENVMTNTAATAIGGGMPLRNMLYSKRYKVLKTGTVQCPTLPITNDSSAMTSIEQEGVDVPFECFVDLKGLKVEFFANAGTYADITNNALFFMMVASGTAVTNSVTYNSRLRFRG